ncbi:MAG: hypothetical protein IT186_24755 [Acidobacteria bacterium]|nr:hypothetical protein [Acidobacteriota bacterium]MCG3195361.1 hypothetical protein [Thermoanaerobaculia bacterium]
MTSVSYGTPRTTRAGVHLTRARPAPATAVSVFPPKPIVKPIFIRVIVPSPTVRA